MYKRVLVILTIIIVFFIFVWKNNDIKTENILKESDPNNSFVWKKETESFSEENKYKIDFSYPTFTDENIATKKIDSKISEFVDENIRNAKNDFNELLSDTDVLVAGELTLLGDFNISDNNKLGVINIMYEIYNYSGGAHGITQVFYFAFDKKTGEILELKDLFNNKSGAIKALSELSIKEVKRIDPKLEIYNQVEEGASPKEENFKNFALDPAGFRIKFSDYQIGPYIAGRLEIILPYEDLKDVLNERFTK